VSSDAREDGVEIPIADDGDGIPADTVDQIFEPLIGARSLAAGLGLPRVTRVMEMQGRGVEVDSAPGRGTEVTLWLAPRERAAI
jgi:nitrogen-specific signal transduction histidine kinase